MNQTTNECMSQCNSQYYMFSFAQTYDLIRKCIKAKIKWKITLNSKEK